MQGDPSDNGKKGPQTELGEHVTEADKVFRTHYETFSLPKSRPIGWPRSFRAGLKR